MTILFVDDESREMDSFRLELVMTGHEVAFKTKTDDAWKYFEENLAGIDMLILDIMMPSGSLLNDEDTENGLRTGILFFQKLREKEPRMPVVILTNVSDKSVADWFNDQPRCVFLRKEDVFPFQLAEKVDELFQSTKRQ